MEKIKNWVLLRGLVRESRHWGDFADIFARQMQVPRERVITLDLPGFGLKETEALISVADMAEDIRAQWISKKDKLDGDWGGVAMSLGAMAVFEWIRLFPEDLRAFVSINASASDLSKPWQRFSLLQLPRAFRISLSRDLRQRESEIYRMTSNGPDAEIKGSQWSEFAPTRAQFLQNGLRQLLAAVRFRSPQRVETPLLILTSKADTFVDYRCSEALAHKYKAPLRVHLHAGHDLCLDDPDWVIQQIKTWLNE